MWGNWFMAFLAGAGALLLVVALAFMASPLIAFLVAGGLLVVIAIVWSMLRGGRETRPQRGEPADPAAPIGAEGSAAGRVERQRSGEPVPSEAWSER
jgi:membrane protein implicated in regulation of membrane protease activity